MMDQSLGRLDKFILAISLVGACVFGVLLWNENILISRLASNNPSLEPIGRIEFSRNDVRRRVNRSLMWHDLSSEEVVFDRDSIFTGENSETEISLGDGNTIQVGASSLVVIRRDGDEVSLDLQAGTLMADLSGQQSISIKNGNEKAKLKSTDGVKARIIRIKNGGVRMAPKAGSVEVHILGKTETVGDKENLIISQDLKIEKQLLSVDALGPTNNTVASADKNGQLVFEWSKANPNEKLKFQLSESADFRTTVLAKKTNASKLSVEAKNLKPETKYYWRLTTQDEVDPQPLSQTVAFNFSSNEGPELIYPTVNLNLTAKKPLGESDTLNLSFEWTPKAGARKYQLQVATDKNFSAPVFDIMTNKTRYEPVALPKGTYHWRVSAERGESEPMLWSQIGTFFVDKTENLQVVYLEPTPATDLTPPPAEKAAEDLQVLFLEPGAGESLAEVEAQTAYGPPRPIEKPKPLFDVSPLKLVKKDLKVLLKFDEKVDVRSPSSVADQLLNPPKFQWQNRKKIKKYIIQISKEKTFKKPLVSETLKDNSFDWRDVTLGNFYWRVQGVYANGDKTEPSSTGTLKTQLAPPAIPPSFEFSQSFDDPKYLTAVYKPVKVQWQNLPWTESYNAILAKDPDMKQVVAKKQVKDSGMTLELADEGQYYLSVAAMKDEKRKLSSYTKPVKVNLEKKLSLEAPQVQLPIDGVTMVSFGGSRQEPILFKWSDVKNVKHYELQMSRAEDFSGVYKNIKKDSASFVFKDSLEANTTYWRVRAVHGKHTSDWSKVRQIEVQKIPGA